MDAGEESTRRRMTGLVLTTRTEGHQKVTTCLRETESLALKGDIIGPGFSERANRQRNRTTVSVPTVPPPTPPALMNLTRFEAFTDGVFAIVMTLLVIEIKVPHLPENGGSFSWLVETLGHQVLSYFTSFLVIGVIWINHHALFHLIKRVDRATLVLNLLLMMAVAFIPFSTALLGDNPRHLTSLIFYGAWLGLTGTLYNILWLYVMRQYIHTERLMADKTARTATFWSISFPLSYFAAAAIAPVSPAVSIALYVLIPLYYLLPGVIDRHLGKIKQPRHK
ncbi:MAG: TMEM175 family protein [Nitrospiraceae bacterium]|nr:TMEM175 family protein [Nitrospiraceae bacterium]